MAEWFGAVLETKPANMNNVRQLGSWKIDEEVSVDENNRRSAENVFNVGKGLAEDTQDYKGGTYP